MGRSGIEGTLLSPGDNIEKNGNIQMRKGGFMLCYRIIAAVLMIAFAAIGHAADIDGSITYDGNERTYYLHIPPQYNEEDPLPLLIALHFYGGTGEAMAMTTNLNAKADQEGFIAVYPDALGSPPSWDMYGDVGFTSALIDSLLDEYGIDTLRIFAAGYSNGAFMAHVLAADLSKRIAAVSMVAGGLMITYWWEFSLDRPISTIHFHARDDAAVPYDGSQGTAPVEEMLQSWSTQNGCTEGPDSFWHTAAALRQTWSNPDGDVENVLWSTNEGGHYNWPTESGPHEISANDLMWEFFIAHPMPEDEPAVAESQEPTSGLKLHVPEIVTDKCRVSLSLDTPESVYIVLFDATGRKAGTYSRAVIQRFDFIDINTSDLESGVYYLKVSTPTLRETARVIVVD
ncbi:T9SS type A sorting domain-containing protein [candidate division WOR-3 bacterium]|uniref:T9SS type A sorting domain-containing protein n=1 Tax=candidate division WOR-3 bacterium TaxID=2052148 RepID=A0A9D5KBQ7_UNCW3|nr:T9SS type A sorting domain-containing protein [candidate division WOR-3 bacterium]MBD3365155.1 T9SS type A sorting domain-containing protein [candidate division WOR-3 bacterium]